MLTSTDSIGFIGTGNMGTPITRQLLDAGLRVRAYDRQATKLVDVAERGAIIAGSVADATTPAGVVISMVTDDAALREVSLVPGGVLDRLGAGGVHVSMSTISPALSDELTERYRERGSEYVAAPVLGRPDVAAAGRLSILVAGAAQAKERVRPALDAAGARVHDFGERPASASAAKVAVNFLIASAIEALAEAGGLADRAGVDRGELLRAALESGLFGGAVYEGYGKMIAEHTYSPAVFRVALGIKDAMLAEQLATEVGASVPIVSLARQHLEVAEAAGWGAEDWAVIGRVLAGDSASDGQSARAAESVAADESKT